MTEQPLQYSVLAAMFAGKGEPGFEELKACRQEVHPPAGIPGGVRGYVERQVIRRVLQDGELDGAGFERGNQAR